MPTDLIISFDSEDYLTPEAADAERWWAEALRQRGLRGSFQLVAELVRSLEARGRDDVLDAIAHHEIGYHSDTHSQPPTHPELLEGTSLSEGIAEILRRETPGIATLAQRFGRWPITYCSPGDSWTPATLLAMARMGIQVFCNDALGRSERSAHWYLGLLTASYALDFQYHYEDRNFEPGGFERAFDQLVAETPEDGVVVLYTHPCRQVTSAFWDQAFARGRRRAIADCPPAPLRDAGEIERIKQRCSGWLDWLAGRDDLRCIDFATFYRERAAERRDLDQLRQETGLAPGEEGQLPLRTSGEEAWLPSSAFDRMRYGWVPYPPGFEGRELIAQAAGLAWTAGPARKQGTEALA